MTRKIITLISILALFALAAPALAKVDPYVEAADAEWGGLDNPYAVWSPSAALGLFGRLEKFGDVDAFAYTFDAAFPGWELEVLVPVCGAHFVDAYPSIAVIGPGLDTPADGALPFALPEGLGAQVLTEGEHPLERAIQDPNVSRIPTPFETYQNTRFKLDIPQAGDYMVAVFEPGGHVGGYVLMTGNNQDEFADRTETELNAAINAMIDGGWMGQDCDAPLAAATCPASFGERGDAQIPLAPERSDVGDGFELTGMVRDSATCLPIVGAEIVFWMANADGEYDGVGEGKLFTNRQGGYRIESARPGMYSATPHIHMAVSAFGYPMLVTEYLLDADGQDVSGTFDISLRPR